ncbi:MAG: hypothetical protein RR298_06810 [Alistipes sp.]
MTIQEAIRQMAAAGLELYAKVCTVDTVDEKARTVDCTPIDEGAPLLGVNLQANQEGEHGVVVFPAQGSYVVVVFLNPAAALVVLAEKVDKIQLKIGDTTAEVVDGQIDIAIKDTTAKLTGGQVDVAVKDTTLKMSPEGVVINGGGLGGMIKIRELTAKVNELIDAFNNHTHEIPSGSVAVTGSATAQANAAPVSVPAITSRHKAVVVSDYEDKKVKH